MGKSFLLLFISFFIISCNNKKEESLVVDSKKETINIEKKFNIEFSNDKKISFWIPNNYKKENNIWIEPNLGKIEINTEKNSDDIEKYANNYYELLKSQNSTLKEIIKTFIMLNNRKTTIIQYELNENNVIKVVYLLITDFEETKYILQIITTKEEFLKNQTDFDKIISSVKTEYSDYLTTLKIKEINDKLKINEFYIGMEIEEALNLINNTYQLKPSPSLDAVIDEIKTAKCFPIFKIVESNGLLSIEGSEIKTDCNASIYEGDYGSFTNYIINITADKITKKVNKISFYNTDKVLSIFKKLFKTDDYKKIVKIIEKNNNIKLKKGYKDSLRYIDKYNILINITEFDITLMDSKLFLQNEQEIINKNKKLENSLMNGE